jgi:hypothetical protein
VRGACVCARVCVCPSTLACIVAKTEQINVHQALTFQTEVRDGKHTARSGRSYHFSSIWPKAVLL